jgi:hypothetical protein
MMNVKERDVITELETGEKLTVDGIWPKGTSKYIDFTAKYQTPIGRNGFGDSLLFAGRGFKFADKGVTWAKELSAND